MKVSKEVSDSELKVSKIKEGTVIDHVKAGTALIVLEMLGITGFEGTVATLSMNVPSKRQEKKDIVKIEDRFLERSEINQIALISPKATINEIKDFKVVNKFDVELPNVVSGFPKCINPKCITNAREPQKQTYYVKSIEPLKIRCKYCNIDMDLDDVIKQLTKFQGLTH
ncbi:MAG: aspartate carbamoyltransferase regulatory subunit [Candidatus Heimdallarchaeota archaeon]|nr:aspartate carbamoyltransferase regulatory subunit [Candidatus Heimdallarchaeota archaeon]MBY8994946.1 aspartate carbamoyltransferase regulatory subunit [Candidatus Heimdallarchaeota archaeon]